MQHTTSKVIIVVAFVTLLLQAAVVVVFLYSYIRYPAHACTHTRSLVSSCLRARLFDCPWRRREKNRSLCACVQGSTECRTSLCACVQGSTECRACRWGAFCRQAEACTATVSTHSINFCNIHSVHILLDVLGEPLEQPAVVGGM